VEAVGENVKRFKVGDEVFGDLSEDGWGAFAQYVRADEDKLALKPESMSFEQAACMSHGGNLAAQGLIDYGKIEAGQKVLINGGCGSTGTLAIQIAKLFDTEVTGVDRTEKLETMLALGADHVIDYTKVDCTNTGSQYDLIFDVKTNRPPSHYKRALSTNGAYATVGGQTSRLLQMLVAGKLSRKHRMQMVMYRANKDLQYLIDLFMSGELKPVIDKCFPLEQAAGAFSYFGEGAFRGKVVVTID
jgi:NADPH:quinone reductase-like Zn-dependent oxidoreductase